MKILVCLKQVPGEARFDRTTHTVIREERNQVMNPSDLYALETALELKERLGAEVGAISMGKPFAAKMLAAAAALGADALYLVSDPAFAGSDTYATASILAAAIRHIGGADLTLCGRRSIDGETGQVGPQLSVMLRVPCLTNVSGIVSAAATRLVCARLLEDRREIWRVAYPCLLTVCEGVEGITHPRLAGIADMIRARSLPVRLLTRKELPDVEAFGRKGSPTQVRKAFTLETRERACLIETNLVSGAAKITDALRRARTKTA
ncbi:MAG: electron transfer flavoprotein subunit beta/FixA family protein [Candidatus Accumulibacter sp.]|jgi:electron transfer flavoprotein beta subunit|nr:electron transfer flavoprotein subunit beta/FixA family protein [Accumulibacter sp.]